MALSFKQTVQKTISTYHLINSADTILVGVSGGADSIALLHILETLRTDLSFNIHVAHINHHLRKGSNADQEFVKKTCSILNLPLTTQDLDLKKAIKQGGSIEEIAREHRLKAFIQIAKHIGADKIALAHHRDDLAETVLLRILRGTGLQGLQAILPKRMLKGSLFIRPLLDVTRKDIEQYLKNNRMSFRTDPTNQHTHFFRNKIRLHLLPLLQKDYQNNIAEILCNLASTAGKDYDYIHMVALKSFPKLIHKNKKDTKLNLDLKKLKQLPYAILRMSLRLAIEKHKGDTNLLTLQHLRELEDLIHNRPTGSVVDLPRNMHALKTEKTIVIH